MARRNLAQCCVQCDYLSFFLAGRSFRGLSLSLVRLCHFNDSNRIWSSPSIVLSDLAKAHVASACPTSLN